MFRLHDHDSARFACCFSSLPTFDYAFYLAGFHCPTPNVMIFSSVPCSPMVSASAISTTTISLFWNSASAGTMVDGYEVMWEADDIGGCSGGSDMDNTTISASSTSYVIMGLEEDSSYTIIVTALNAVGSGEDTVIAMTLEAGEK